MVYGNVFCEVVGLHGIEAKAGNLRMLSTLGGCGETSTCQRPGGKPWKTLVSKNNQKIERLKAGSVVKAGSVGFWGCVFRILGMDDLWSLTGDWCFAQISANLGMFC